MSATAPAPPASSGRGATVVDRAVEWIDENLRPFGLLIAIFGGLVLYLAVVAVSWQYASYNVWGALLVAPALVALTVPIARRIAYEEHDPTMVRLLMGALVLKLLMTLVRYGVVFGYYGGNADAALYDGYGKQLYRLFRAGDLRTLGQPLSGTGFIKVLTGVIYAITGPTAIGGFLAFSWLGFWGLYFFYRAFRLAVPEGDHRRYAYLLFFLPSMLFWPSSIGKESWMCFTLGVAAYGLAKILDHQRGGQLIMAAGLLGSSAVRPHVALIFFVAMAVAYLVRRGRSHRFFGVLPKLIGILLIVVVGIYLVGKVQSFVKVDDLATQSTQALTRVGTNSDQGGSSFKAVPPTTPTRYVWATLTVLFRPFLYEAGNPLNLVAALEGTFLLALSFLSIPRAVDAFRNIRARPYPLCALIYVLIFDWAFSSISNFGILTRQRVQVLPFLLVLLCLPRRSLMGATPNEVVVGAGR